MLEINESIIYGLLYNRLSDIAKDNIYSSVPLQFPVDQEDVLKKIFLKPFLNHTTSWRFSNAFEYSLRSVVSEFFKCGDLVSASKKIHGLLNVAKPDIGLGNCDLFIIHFNKLRMGDGVYQGIGIYKLDYKEAYLNTNDDGVETYIQISSGISDRKIEKGVLILDTEGVETIYLVDRGNFAGGYWKHDFVGVELKQDDMNNTSFFLDNARSFITETLPGEYELDKVAQAELMNRTIDYFKANEKFDRSTYEKEVLMDDGVIESFKEFDSLNNNIGEYVVDESFEISQKALKKQLKRFKSVIKFDNNFHLYIHGDAENVEQGQDADGRKYFKIYYENQS